MKSKKYVLLYYFSFVVTYIFMGFACYKYMAQISIGDNNFTMILSDMLENIFSIINLTLVIIFTVLLLKKKKMQDESVLFPIVYLSFFAIVVVFSFLFNNKVLVPYMHFEYYSYFISIGYLFFNIYSLLLFKEKK